MSTIKDLLQLALQQSNSEDRRYDVAAVLWQRDPVKLLLELPAAAQLQADTVAGMLQVVLQKADLRHAELFLQHAAARDIAPRQYEELLHMLLQRSDLPKRGIWSKTLRQLLGLPSIEQLDTAAASQLVRNHCGRREVLWRLLQTPLAQKLDTATVSQLMLHHSGSWDIINTLVVLPAAQQIETSTIAVLLDVTVFNRETDTLVRELLRIPAAKGLSAERVAELLKACLQSGLLITAGCLLEHLVGACKGQLAAAMLVDILRMLILQTGPNIPGQLGSLPLQPDLVAHCCNTLPGVADLNSQQVIGLIGDAVAVGCANSAVALLNLPAVEDFTSSDVAKILHQSCQQVQLAVQNVKLVQPLCALEAASNLVPAQLEPLTRSAIRQQGTFRTQMQQYGYWAACYGQPTKLEIELQAAWDGILAALCKLPAAAGCKKSSNRSSLQQHLQPAAVTELLQHATRSGNPTAVVALCKLPGAAGIDAGNAAELLAAAAQHKLCSNEYELLWPVALQAIQTLLGLPAVQAIGPNNTAHVLRIALQHVHEQGGSALGRVEGSADTEFQHECCPLVSGFCGLPGARRLSKQTVADLVALAAVHGNVSAMLVLQQL